MIVVGTDRDNMALTANRLGAAGGGIHHSLLALVVIPEIRISDVGIIDVTRFEEVGLFV